MLRNRWVYAMMIPVIVYFVMFKYIPIANLRIAFTTIKSCADFPEANMWDCSTLSNSSVPAISLRF